MDCPPDQFSLAVQKQNLRVYELKLAAAKEAARLVGPLEELVRLTTEIIRLLEALEVQPEISKVQVGEFLGMRFLEALRAYLEKLRRAGRTGARVEDEAVGALVKGGAVTMKGRKPFAEVAQTARYRILVNFIRENSLSFHYDENTDSVSLHSTLG